MSKSYNIGKKSDMQRFKKDLEKTVLGEARQQVQAMKYDVACPHCGNKVNIPTGKSACPVCRKEIDLTLNINF